jgi:thiol-disulfide isomerase/thioredoxin
MHDLDWHSGNPDAAFAQARALNLPVFLYWGASWCPPCNRTKATAFADPAFAVLAQRFVALHIDGDSAGAQQMAERFQVRSYPTLVVLRADGAEVTRLPCELDAQRLLHTLAVALDAPCTAAESLHAALSGERALTDAEWHVLSYYSYDTDELQLLKDRDLAATLASLARSCTLPDAALRLRWHALHAAGQAGAIDDVMAALADPQAVRAQMDLVNNYALDLVRALSASGSEARLQLTRAWSDALQALETDAGVGVGDQLGALRNRVRMARLGAPVAGLEQQARERVAQAVAAVSEPALRHTVINTAAGVLSDAGLLDEAEQLLLAELARAHSPFYFMHNLAAIAKKRGDTARVLQCYEQAWEGATGPATRLQWGTTYLLALLDFAPEDAVRVDRLAAQMLAELQGRDDAFFQRNRTQMQRIDAKLAKWSGAGEHATALREAARPFN